MPEAGILLSMTIIMHEGIKLFVMLDLKELTG